LIRIQNMLESENCNLLQFQKVHGKLNNFCNLCPLTKGFRAQQNEFLKNLQKVEPQFQKIPKEVKKELKFWMNCIRAAESTFPIPDLTEDPPALRTEIFSDAAGAAFSNENQLDDQRGAAAIVTNCFQKIEFISKVTWPKNFQNKFAHKSHILEIIGVLLPIIANPCYFVNKNILCYVDNLSVVFNWEKRSPKGDEIFKNLFKILHLLESTLPCKIFIEHVYRRSCKFSKLADDLTREQTTKQNQLQILQQNKLFLLKGPLKHWLENPVRKDNLYIDVLDCIYDEIKNK
jgi:hypothetical protein